MDSPALDAFESQNESGYGSDASPTIPLNLPSHETHHHPVEKQLAITYEVPQRESSIDQSGAVDGGTTYMPDERSTEQATKTPKKVLVNNDEKLKDSLEDTYGIQSNAKKELERKIKNNFGKTNAFATGQNRSFSVSNLRTLLRLCDSTGAVAVKLGNGEMEFLGTCFRVGPIYVMTNFHVLQNCRTYVNHLENIYIDFSHTNERDIFVADIIVESQEMDYVVLEVTKPEDRELPPSVTSFFMIPPLGRIIKEGMYLTLTGHPNGSAETMIDVVCPLGHLETLRDEVWLSLSQNDTVQLLDERRQTYHVSTFFYGSSGSPVVSLHEGFLMMLHCRGFPLENGQGWAIEQGILISSIVKDVEEQKGIEMAKLVFDLP